MSDFSSFPGNLFAILVSYFQMGHVGFGMIVGHTVLVNSTSDVAAVFSDSILQTSAQVTHLCRKGYNFLLGKTICRQCLV